MAIRELEAEFVFTFWFTAQITTAVEKIEGGDLVGAAMSRILPAQIASDDLRAVYEALCQRIASGDGGLTPAVIASETGTDAAELADLLDDLASSPKDLPALTARVEAEAKRNQFESLVRKAIDYSGGMETKDVRRAADRLALRLMELNGEQSSGQVYTTAEIASIGKRRADAPPEGVTLPWRPLQYEAGPWIPGELIAVTGYSGDGKSTVAANLFVEFGFAGHPQIVFPTEMKLQWFDRAAAIASGTDAWRAEKGVWRGHEEERDAFKRGHDRVAEFDYIMPRAANFSIEEIVTTCRILRRRWRNTHPVIFIDHMHRLNYRDDVNKEVGKATRLLKELAQAEGLIVVALYQPKKPPQEKGARYGPPGAHEIRGDSAVWNEIDCCLAPFRQWVKTSPMGTTEWGTAPCIYTDTGFPKTAKPNTENSKIDDEHFYIKVDKRRVGGEGPVVMLDYHKPSNRIFVQQDAAPATPRAEAIAMMEQLNEAGWNMTPPEPC